MNIKHKLIMVVTLLISVTALSQQDPHYSLYKYNMNLINPAAVASQDSTSIGIAFRQQWFGVDDAPSVQGLNFQKQFGTVSGGISIVRDKVFIQNETSIYVDFAYGLDLSESTKLNLGLKAGGTALSVDFNKLTTQDAANTTEEFSKFNPNVGLGAYLQGEKYYITVSTPRILKSKRYEEVDGQALEASDEMHLYAGAGYEIDANEKVTIIPSLLTRTVSGSPMSMDLGLTGRFNNMLEAGFNYRLDESISILALMDIKQVFDIGLAYEITTSDLKEESNGSVDVLMKYKF